MGHIEREQWEEEEPNIKVNAIVIGAHSSPHSLVQEGNQGTYSIWIKEINKKHFFWI